MAPIEFIASAVSSSSASAVCHSLTEWAYSVRDKMTLDAARAEDAGVVPFAEPLSAVFLATPFSPNALVAASTSANVFACSRIATSCAFAEAVVPTGSSPEGIAPAPAPAPGELPKPASPSPKDATSGRYRDRENKSVASCVRSDDRLPVTANSRLTACTTCLQQALSASASISMSCDARCFNEDAKPADSPCIAASVKSPEAFPLACVSHASRSSRSAALTCGSAKRRCTAVASSRDSRDRAPANSEKTVCPYEPGAGVSARFGISPGLVSAINEMRRRFGVCDR